jgi:polysaccharide deacetylase family protein (PEP-CTERM system associated)
MYVADFVNFMPSSTGRKHRFRIVKNLLTIDLEDWHQLAYRRITGETPLPQGHVLRQMDLLLELLQRHQARATFFVLGSLAKQFPELPRNVASLGHEIGSHGYDHLVAHRLTRHQFEEDTRRSKEVLEDIVGQPVCGYRAAEFSIRADSLWALEVLAELGFKYDSSIFPIYHRRYGIPGFFPRAAEYLLPNNVRIKEIPLSTLSWRTMRAPIAGGGCFRVLPTSLLCRAVRRLNDSGTPLVTYFHPYEFDSQRLNVFDSGSPRHLRHRLRGLQWNFHQNLGRRTMTPKLATLLQRYSFTTIADFLREGPSLECKKLF